VHLRGVHRGPLRGDVAHLSDSNDIADTVALVNGLPGSMTCPFTASCPVMMSETRYRVSFQTSDGIYLLRFDATNCFPQVTLFRNGIRTRPTLDPQGTGVADAQDSYLARGQTD